MALVAGLILSMSVLPDNARLDVLVTAPLTLTTQDLLEMPMVYVLKTDTYFLGSCKDHHTVVPPALLRKNRRSGLWRFVARL